jgi:transcriptional regulator with XRE-family HTH domain
MVTQSKMARSLKGLAVTRPRTKEPDLTDPRGQLGAYLRYWIDKNHAGDAKRLADALGISARAVTKWCEGESGPDLFKLDLLAKEMGFSDWSKLAAAAVKFSAS